MHHERNQIKGNLHLTWAMQHDNQLSGKPNDRLLCP